LQLQSYVHIEMLVFGEQLSIVITCLQYVNSSKQMQYSPFTATVT